MAACKFTNALTIRKSALPVTCVLQNPPNGATIELAELFDPTGVPTNLTVSADGQSFLIPNTVAAGNWQLEVRIIGGRDPIPAIHLIEDCDLSQRILTVADPVSKMARAALVVQP
jgi:hypothetical protein